MRANLSPIRIILTAATLLLVGNSPAFASHNRAPDWMHALTSVPLPPHDEKDNAVVLYKNDNLAVVNQDKFLTTVQVAIKILRPEGRDLGIVRVYYRTPNQKVTSIHGWCIPQEGKDYEVGDKDSVDVSPQDEDVLVNDLRIKGVQIPAPDVGNIIGYEYVVESRPLVLQDGWSLQGEFPVKSSIFSLTLPSGWEFKSAWINSPETQPQDMGGGQWKWQVNDLKEIREEEEMPPWRGVAGQMIVTLFPPGGGARNSFPSWRELGLWYYGLDAGQRNPSAEIKQQVATLTASAPTPLAKMRGVGAYVQHDLRYVAVELGVGGWQPHPAAEIYEHHYADCKDKVNLLITMLHELGIDAYDVRINDERGAVGPNTPAHMTFNHSIAAIKLPEGIVDPSLAATIKHPTLGTLLFFDPTNEKIPFGELPNYLQANYGLLITPAGGELVELPQEPSMKNGIQRTAKLALSPAGVLRGEVHEVRVGDRASSSRFDLADARNSVDRVKPLERLLSSSLSSFQIGNATITNPNETRLPFIWDYSFQADSYAKFAGDMLLVRPRVLGNKARGTLETSEPRRFDIEFDDGPVLDTDDFEITLPSGYVVDDVPSPVDADFGFASYHSKTEVVGNVLRYHRTFEEKELSVPVSKADQLKKFYRIISADERNTAVLKLQAH